MSKSRRQFMAGALTAGFGSMVLTGTARGVQAMSEDPIPGVDVVVEKVPPGNAVARSITDQRGIIMLRSLEAGYYEVRNAEDTMRAGIRHPGGPVRWQLRQRSDGRRPAWILVAVGSEAPARR